MSRIRLADVNLELWDEGAGAPIVLLHGFPTCNMLWRDVAPALIAAGYRILAPDLVGYGRSDAGEHLPSDMGSQAAWLLRLLDELHLKRALLVAHDVGTAAAQLLVATAPGRVRGLVLMDGVFGDQWAMDAVESIRSFDPSAAASLYRILVRRMRRQWTRATVSDDAIQAVLGCYEGSDGGSRLIRAARSLDARQTMQILDDLKRVAVPCRVLWGEKDPFLSVDAVARPLADLFGAKLKLLPGGHFLPLDCPSEVASEIIAFVRDLPPDG